MDVDKNIATVSSKKKVDKIESPTDHSTVRHETKKLEKKSDIEDPKPRIVLTFRSEKPGAKSSSMKIVSTEEKHEEFSPRRSSRTRAARWESDDENETLESPKKERTNLPTSENDEASDSSQTTLKRTQRRGKEFDNVVANAIARKEKSYSEMPVTTRLSRRIKPTAKVLANEELRIGLESQNNARLGIQQEKSPEEGAQARRPVRGCRQKPVPHPFLLGEEAKHEKKLYRLDSENSNQVMKLKHLCELGLKAINPEVLDEDLDKADDGDFEEMEAIEIEDEPEGPDEEIDDDSEVISKLLEADAESFSTSDEEFFCSEEPSQSDRPRRSTRLCSSYGANDSDHSSILPVDEDESAPRRRSSRARRRCVQSYEEIVGIYRPQHKKSRPNVQEDTQSEVEPEEISNPAGAEEGQAAACPGEDTTIIATCFCEAPSNVHASSSELIEPVFCQAIELVDSVRVGCSHAAHKDPEGAYSALVRAGPRAPFFLACKLHTMQLRKHMCCPACGLFCSQGVFYQCSKGHLFHLECGLPYNEAKGKPGCPHCGVTSYRWQPANRDCCKVKLEMKCSNKLIFLPDQREQCTPAYLGFSTLDPAQLDKGPVIPEDLLPSPPIDLKRLCIKPQGPADYEDLSNSTPAQRLCDAILAGETADELIPKIMSGASLNARLPSVEGGTCAHAAARRGNLTALYLLHYAGADLNAVDFSLATPLIVAVLALLDKSEIKTTKKSTKVKLNKDAEDTEVDQAKEVMEEDSKSKKNVKSKMEPKEENLMKVIRYLVAAGCDVNMPGPDGMTALHVAAQLGGEAACAAILGTAAAELDARDHGGWTPLVWAAENCHASVVRLLLSHGADAAASDSEGNAAVHWCALAGSAHALQMLLEAAPDAVAAVNPHADTPLHVAARQGHYACVVILLARGARTDVENSAGELPVEVCSGQCQSAISLNMQMCIALRDKASPRRLLSSDISNGREAQPVPCVNDVDDAPLPDDFTYVTAHVTPRAVPVDCTTDSLRGCTCKGGDCSSSTCSCCVLGVRRWATRGRLQPGFPYHDPPMLFECNQTCACNAKKCSNSLITRAVQRGSVFVRAAVFRCGGARGWGLRAGAPVPRGAPVATYCGELLSMPDADTRSGDQYMFALDVKPDLLEQCTEKVQLCVDAAQYGSAARFINHSCRPNLAPVRVFTSTRDLRLPTVALFATRDIAAGEEFTFDYGDKFWSVKSKWMECECGAPDCRYPVKATEEADAFDYGDKFWSVKSKWMECECGAPDCRYPVKATEEADA